MPRPKRVYIASPYWHKELIIRTENAARQVYIANALMDLGFDVYWPLCSHHLAQSGIGKRRSERAWLEHSMRWLETCDILLRVQLPSKGADLEEARALELGMPIYATITELISTERR